MQDIYGIRAYGKTNIKSRFGACEGCRKFTTLNSYDTARFAQLFHIPLLPLGHVHIIDECALCGYHDLVSKYKYKKKRAKALSTMMQNLKEMPEYPDHVINGMQTLMTYDEKHWFTGMVNQYRRLFENHVQFQVIIAEGLCRFGDYHKSEEACLKAIQLEAGKRADDLLANCKKLHEASLKAQHVEELHSDKLHMMLPYLATPSIITAVAALFVVQGILAARVREVWIVNGSQIPYTIQVGKTPHELAAYETLRLKLKFGDHPIELSGANFPTNQLHFIHPIPTYSALPRGNVLLLNPDSMALFIQEKLSPAGIQQHFFYGKRTYTLSNIDYPFEAFPSGGLLRKKVNSGTRLFQRVPESYEEMTNYLIAQQQTNLLVHFARTALTLQPDIPEAQLLLPYATRDLSPEELQPFLEIGRSLQPAQLVWHLFYQAYMQRHYPHHDLQTEYARRCNAFPEDHQNFFLLARVVHDRSKAMILFENSESSPHIQGRGYHEMARYQLRTGQFEKARQAATHALEKAPSNSDFQHTYNQTLLALGKYEELLLGVQKQRTRAPNDSALVTREIKFLTILGRHKEAALTGATFASAHENKAPDYTGILWGHYLDAARYYAVGNMKDYLEALQHARAPRAAYERMLHTGKMTEAYTHLMQQPEASYIDFLTLFCAASFYQQETTAYQARAEALKRLHPQTPAEETAKQWIAGQRPLTIDALAALELSPAEKRVIAATLGFTHPTKQRACFTIARTFNIDPDPPYQLLKRWMK